MNPVVRTENSSDQKAVFEINTLAFGQENEARLVDALRQNHSVFIPELSLVATIGSEVAGHILFTKIQILDINGNSHQSLALAPMAVAPKFQKSGIGSLLIRKGIETAKILDYQSVIVLGHEHFYPKFGFIPAAKWNIKAPFDVPPEVFMAMELENGALQNVTGTVVYPGEFTAV